MNWQSVREAYPDQWLIVEALSAFTTPEHQRTIEKMSVIQQCPDGEAAFASYRALHQQYPDREFYFVHTSRVHLDIHEVHWLGVRRNRAAYPAR